MKLLIASVICLISLSSQAGNLSTLIRGSSSSGATNCSSGTDNYSVGGKPHFCQHEFLLSGARTKTNINIGKECDSGKICLGGECVTDTSTCASGTAALGSPCKGGLYIGSIGQDHYVAIPNHCTGTINPTCTTVTHPSYMGPLFKYSTATSGGALGETGATSTSDGPANTTYLTRNYPDAQAAHYCNDLVYGGYDDWFLPAIDEAVLISNNYANLGYYQNSSGTYYSMNIASSTQSSATNYFHRQANVSYAYGLSFSYTTGETSKNVNQIIKCVRKFSVD